MRWQDFRRSDNVEESSGSGSSGMGGGMRLGGGALIVVVVVSLLLGKNPLEILALLGDGGAPQVQTQTTPYTAPSTGTPTPRDGQKEFVARVLGDTEDVWGGVFQQLGTRYEAPNPEQWARSPYDVAREGVELTQQLLRDAVPGYVSA